MGLSNIHQNAHRTFGKRGAYQDGMLCNTKEYVLISKAAYCWIQYDQSLHNWHTLKNKHI